MQTAGKVEVSIPVVVTPDGEVNSAYWIDEDGKNHTDEALLFEHFPIGQPVKLIRITATIDLDRVFDGHEIEGEIDLDPDPC